MEFLRGWQLNRSEEFDGKNRRGDTPRRTLSEIVVLVTRDAERQHVNFKHHHEIPHSPDEEALRVVESIVQGP